MSESRDTRDRALAQERALARDLILSCGWNTTCYQILNPGFQLWFAPERDAVVGYVRSGGYRVVGGAPVCRADRLGDVASAFEAEARRREEHVCYFGAEGRLETLYRESGSHALLALGGQPVWEPGQWAGHVRATASLRAQINRTHNKGVVVVPWATDVAEASDELKEVLRRWLQTRGLPPLHFLIEPDTLANLHDRRCFVARQGHRVVGFAVFSPIPARNGWLVEQFVRAPDAPNGTIEALLDAGIRDADRRGSDYVTLGLAPLAERTLSAGAIREPWLRLLMRLLRDHCSRYYNFVGLEAFKAKLQPDRWEPVYALVNEARIRPALLWAIAGAFSGGSPLKLIRQVVLRPFTRP